MIRLSVSIIIVFFAFGLIAGVAFFRKATKPPMDYEELYSTVAGGYLSDDPRLLELQLICMRIQKRVPDAVASFIAALQQNELLLKVPNGGTFIVIDSQASKLFPEHTFLKLKGVTTDTVFWTRLSSVRKLETKEGVE